MDRYPEREVSPGIYMTDFRRQREDDENELISDAGTISSPASTIVSEIASLENSIQHLLRSNQELKDFIEEERKQHEESNNTPYVPDREFVQAISENEQVIERQRKKVEDLKKKLKNEQSGSGGHYRM